MCTKVSCIICCYDLNFLVQFFKRHLLNIRHSDYDDGIICLCTIFMVLPSCFPDVSCNPYNKGKDVWVLLWGGIEPCWVVRYCCCIVVDQHVELKWTFIIVHLFCILCCSLPDPPYLILIRTWRSSCSLRTTSGLPSRCRGKSHCFLDFLLACNGAQKGLITLWDIPMDSTVCLSS